MAAEAEVAALARQLANRWESTRERWRDGSGRDFGELHMGHLLAEAEAIARAADEAVRAAEESARRSGA